MNFAATVEVARILGDSGAEPPVAFTADVRVRCADCGLPFEFMGVETCGLLFDKPTVDVTAQELRIPITPKGLALLPGIPGFTVRAN